MKLTAEKRVPTPTLPRKRCRVGMMPPSPLLDDVPGFTAYSSKPVREVTGDKCRRDSRVQKQTGKYFIQNGEERVQSGDGSARDKALKFDRRGVPTVPAEEGAVFPENRAAVLRARIFKS